jgi:hypothetical protein
VDYSNMIKHNKYEKAVLLVQSLLLKRPDFILKVRKYEPQFGNINSDIIKLFCPDRDTESADILSSQFSDYLGP